MRKSYWPLLTVLALLLAGLVIFAGPAHAQDLGPNLFRNAGFENGHHYQDGIPKIVVPDEWRMHWSDRELIFGGEWQTARPETVVWNSSGGVPAGEEVYWRDGVYTMKIFLRWAPLWSALSQDVKGLEVGRKYRLSVPIFIDIFEDYKDGKKIAPWRQDSGRVRLGASPVGAAWRDESAINYSGWWTAETVNPFYLAMPTFVWDFVATQPEMTIWIEMASTYPYNNSGFFLDLPGLFALNETAPVAAPPAQNVPAGEATAVPAAAEVPAQPAATAEPLSTRSDGALVHVVQEGETLWLIAIKYAQTLGMTPEQALPYIQELNNNPAFINPGDELIIQPAGTAATPTAAAEATAEGGEATPESEATAAPTEAPAATPTTQVAGTICVGAFQDTNADGQRNDGEPLVPNAAIAIARAGTTVSTYITDGESEPYCFELAQADSYQLQLYPPAGFTATTEDNWAVSIANGESYTVLFGLIEASTETDTSLPGGAANETPAPAETVVAPAPSGLPGNLGIIILGVAAVLVLLAVVGVVLLRRG